MKFVKGFYDEDGISSVTFEVYDPTPSHVLTCKASIVHRKCSSDEKYRGEFINTTVTTPMGFWHWLDCLVWGNRIDG